MKNNNKKRYTVPVIISCFFLLLGFLCFFSARWFRNVYGDLDFDSIIFTLFGNMNGVESNLIYNYLLKAFLPCIIITFIACLVLFLNTKRSVIISFFKRKIKIYPLNRLFSSVVSLILSACLILYASERSGLTDYIYANSHSGTVYEENYVSPTDISINFPDEKRNLIYIFIESLETSFFSENHGGALKNEVIPELYRLASDNINFSTNDSVGGFYAPYGATWTIGAMIAQTSGVHLYVPSGIDGNSLSDYFKEFLPGLTTINDILHNEGYYQTLMVGSDSSFGGRKQYFTQHGIDAVYDLFTARDEGLVPQNYDVWWGMEDLYVYEYAKQKLNEISSDINRPFSFTMLTADTHHVDGYVCKYCESEYSEQYENVFSCASRQLNDFIEWIKQQPFYENTTIVICGDHTTMDGGYLSRNVSSSYSRAIYNCIINSAISTDNSKNRLATSLDMFPTTLAALGCEIEGNKLALGTNLFSDELTLLETFGNLTELNGELSKRSMFYIYNLMS